MTQFKIWGSVIIILRVLLDLHETMTPAKKPPIGLMLIWFEYGQPMFAYRFKYKTVECLLINSSIKPIHIDL